MLPLVQAITGWTSVSRSSKHAPRLYVRILCEMRTIIQASNDIEKDKMIVRRSIPGPLSF